MCHSSGYSPQRGYSTPDALTMTYVSLSGAGRLGNRPFGDGQIGQQARVGSPITPVSRGWCRVDRISVMTQRAVVLYRLWSRRKPAAVDTGSPRGAAGGSPSVRLPQDHVLALVTGCHEGHRYPQRHTVLTTEPRRPAPPAARGIRIRCAPAVERKAVSRSSAVTASRPHRTTRGESPPYQPATAAFA